MQSRVLSQAWNVCEIRCPNQSKALEKLEQKKSRWELKWIKIPAPLTSLAEMKLLGRKARKKSRLYEESTCSTPSHTQKKLSFKTLRRANWQIFLLILWLPSKSQTSTPSTQFYQIKGKLQKCQVTSVRATLN